MPTFGLAECSSRQAGDVWIKVLLNEYRSNGKWYYLGLHLVHVRLQSLHMSFKVYVGGAHECTHCTGGVMLILPMWTGDLVNSEVGQGGCKGVC